VKSLVTGGLGFIGARMCQRLLDEGHEVIVLDIGLAGTRRRIEHPKIKYVFNDVCRYKETRWLYDNVDYVFHMAAVSRVPACEENPTIAFNTNYVGTATVLQCALEAGVKHVVNSSTSAVYGNDGWNDGWGADEYNTNPISHYGHSKYHAELLCKHYNQQHELRTTSLRYFNVYGPGEDASGQYAQVVAIFMDNYRKDQPFKIFGDGTQMRDFIHVDDVVNVNFKCVTHNFYGPDPYGKTFNVGTGLAHSITRIAKAIQPNETNIVFANYRPGDPHKTLANTVALENTFNITPKDRVFDYIKEQLNEI
jgi:UDP-glucose 4-epimerase